MSTHPAQERQFSLSIVFVPVGILLTTTMASSIPLYFSNSQHTRGDVISFLLVMGAFLTVGFWLLYMGLGIRYGIDNESVWVRYLGLFKREIRFTEIDDYALTAWGYRLSAGKSRLRIRPDNFDLSLMRIRLLEELSYRRFTIEGVAPESPNWPVQASQLRYELGETVLRDHGEFFLANPREWQWVHQLIWAEGAAFYVPGAEPAGRPPQRPPMFDAEPTPTERRLRRLRRGVDHGFMCIALTLCLVMIGAGIIGISRIQGDYGPPDWFLIPYTLLIPVVFLGNLIWSVVEFVRASRIKVKLARRG